MNMYVSFYVIGGLGHTITAGFFGKTLNGVPFSGLAHVSVNKHIIINPWGDLPC
jgi:hypothetical protein